MSEYLVTSESVTEGHPDKVCDQIADQLLDCYLSGDKDSHVAIEVMASKDVIFISGEVSSKTQVDIESEARKVLLDIGYDAKEKGMDGKTCQIVINVCVQSADIAMGVTQDGGIVGAGDQGMMFGYACNETKSYMPLSIDLAHKLVLQLTKVRKENILPYLYPDGKSQVTVRYNEDGTVDKITDIVISAQHRAGKCLDALRYDIKREVIEEIIPYELMDDAIKIHINPTGRFVIGGPLGDTGVTGRKIIVDTYGGIARHGGGAFSGKDPTKVDRSSAYMARYAAKNVVAAGFCDKCEVSLAYAIGVPNPVAIRVNTFGTENIPIEIIEDAVAQVFDFSVAAILTQLNLKYTKFRPVAAYGHFGRDDLVLPWERLDKVEALRECAAQTIAQIIIKSRNA